MVQNLDAKEISPRLLHDGKVPRKKVPAFVAQVDSDRCSGCEVCMAFCPVNCITLVTDPEMPTINPTCVVIEAECIGCKICAVECPWDAIEMIPYQPAGPVPRHSPVESK